MRLILTVTSLEAAALSKQEADLFSRKLAQIVVQGDAAQKPGTRRTPVTETELNSWFTYSAKPLLPAGVSRPAHHDDRQWQGDGAGRRRPRRDREKKASGGTFDIWNLVGGRCR